MSAPSARPVRQRGIALITAVLVVSISVIAATAVLSAGSDAIQRASTFQDSERAYWYASGCEDFARSVINRDDTKDVDGLQDGWAKVNGVLPVAQGEGEGTLRGKLQDLQGRFNLNNLGITLPDKPELQDKYRKLYTEQFERLLAGIEGVDALAAQPLAEAIRDWIDPDQEPTGFGGAEDSEYLSRDPPYRTANRKMQSITEVLAVKGMTRELYRKLSPFITVLPEVPSSINVNTAPESVLLAITSTPGAELQAFLRDREEKPAKSNSDLNGLFTAQDVPAQLKVLAYGTHFFGLECEATIGNGRVALYSTLYRPRGGDTVVLARSTDSE